MTMTMTMTMTMRTCARRLIDRRGERPWGQAWLPGSSWGLSWWWWCTWWMMMTMTIMMMMIVATSPEHKAEVGRPGETKHSPWASSSSSYSSSSSMIITATRGSKMITWQWNISKLKVGRLYFLSWLLHLATNIIMLVMRITAMMRIMTMMRLMRMVRMMRMMGMKNPPAQEAPHSPLPPSSSRPHWAASSQLSFCHNWKLCKYLFNFFGTIFLLTFCNLLRGSFQIFVKTGNFFTPHPSITYTSLKIILAETKIFSAIGYIFFSKICVWWWVHVKHICKPVISMSGQIFETALSWC